jgi:hypothetical protein
VERRLSARLGPCAVLKLGHHGSVGSTGPAWLAALKPEVAVASASRFRADRFPGPSLRGRLSAERVTLYETWRFGAVRVRFSDPPFVIPHRDDSPPSATRLGTPKVATLRRRLGLQPTEALVGSRLRAWNLTHSRSAPPLFRLSSGGGAGDDARRHLLLAAESSGARGGSCGPDGGDRPRRLPAGDRGEDLLTPD